MSRRRCSLLSLAITICIIVFGALHSSTSEMTPQRSYTAQRGFFSHDDDPESWEFRATTRVNLGLLDRPYETDPVLMVDNAPLELDTTQWQRFAQHLRYLNKNTENKQYKLLYLVRHGEGLHNVKEKEIGRAEWNVSIAE